MKNSSSQTFSYSPCHLCVYSFIFSLISALFLLSSCNDPEFDGLPSASSNTHLVASRSTSDTLDYFVKALAKAQQNIQVRNFIKNAVSANPWGDNCLVYAMHKDDMIYSHLTFAEILYASRDTNDGRFGIDFFTHDVFVEYPTISIYLYTGDEDVDASSFDVSKSIGVFQIPDDHTTIDSILVYYTDTIFTTSSLNFYKIPSLEEPEEQYMCVGPNSILIAFDTDSFNIYPDNDYHIEEQVIGFRGNVFCEDLLDALINGAPVVININGQDIILNDVLTIKALWCELCKDNPILAKKFCRDSGGGPGNEPCNEEYDRDCRENREELVKYTFTHQNYLDKTCSWTRAKCSFYVNAIYATNTTSTPTPINSIKQFDIAKRKNLKGWKGKWHTPAESVLFLKWDLTAHSDPMKYVWFYDHPKKGTKIEQTINYSGKIKVPIVGELTVGGSTKIITEITDIDCGEQAVYYSDPANGQGSEYSTGKIKFYIKEQE